MELLEVKAEIDAGQADAAEEILLESAGGEWSILQDAIARRAWVVGILPGDAAAAEQWAALSMQLAARGIVPGEASRRVLPDTDWRHSYKAHFRAWQFGRLHWVPVWERETFVLPAGHAVLWLDPGLAFGTGNHETTRLCVERLVACATEFGVQSSEFRVEASVRPGRPGRQNSELQTPNSELRVIDAGCGSGILALSATLLGFENVAGFDNDPEAVRISEENAAINQLGGRVEFRVADLVTGLAGREAEIVLANIQADVLMRFAGELIAAVAPGGTLILSGILAGENAEVRAAFEQRAPQWSVNARTMGEWSDIVLTRPG